MCSNMPRVPNIVAASVAVSLVGFFSGPMFATASLSLPFPLS